MEFKDRLRKLRNDAGLSASSLADKLGKAESTVRMWEIGKAKPDIETVSKIIAIFNCTSDYLLGLSEFKNEETTKEFLSSKKTLEENFDSLEKDLQEYFIGMLNSFFAVYTDYSFSVNQPEPALIGNLANIIRHYSGMIWQAAEFANRVKSIGNDNLSCSNDEVDRIYCLTKINTEKMHLERLVDNCYQYALLTAFDTVVVEDEFKRLVKLFSIPPQTQKDGD